MSAASQAVFLSYASQDAEAARKICDALRAAGIDVWFDQSELRGGDAWDQKLRRQIKECALFVPIISANTQARTEGYFRIEWRLAAQRSHAIAEGIPFLVPVVIDGTPEPAVLAPGEFRDVQWTRIAAGDSLSAFCERARALLGGRANDNLRPLATATRQNISGTRNPASWIGAAAIGVSIIAALSFWQPWRKPDSPRSAVEKNATPAGGITSLAVKPLDDFSGDAKQAYLSDGMTEALCTALSNLSALRVPGRSTVMRYKGSQKTITEMARDLEVDAIVEGSIQRAANEVKIDVRLIDGRSDKTLWTASYVRDLSQFFQMQSEVAQAVGEAIKVQLTPDDRARLARARSARPEVIEAYLLGMQLWLRQAPEDGTAAVRHFLRAIEIDPKFAPAYAGASMAYPYLSLPHEEKMARTRDFAQQAIDLDPQLGDGFVARGLHSFFEAWNWASADADFRRAIELNPNSVLALSSHAYVLVALGRFEEALALAQKIDRLDPLSPMGRLPLAAHFYAGRFSDAVKALQAKREIFGPTTQLGLSYVFAGDVKKALAELEAAERAAPATEATPALAYAYSRAGRRAEALQVLRRWDATPKNLAVGYWYPRAWIQVGLGEMTAALEDLEQGWAKRDNLMPFLKVDPVFAPLRDEPRYQALLKKMGLDR